jgi:hypothetical protein
MPERRTAAKLICFHPDELVRITERARVCGQTPARFIRETALGAIPKARQHGATGALLREMARIGESLDELARLAQAGQHAALAERLTATLDGHWARVRQLAKNGQRSSGTPLQMIRNRSAMVTPITSPPIAPFREEWLDRRDGPRQTAETARANENGVLSLAEARLAPLRPAQLEAADQHERRVEVAAGRPGVREQGFEPEAGGSPCRCYTPSGAAFEPIGVSSDRIDHEAVQ